MTQNPFNNPDLLDNALAADLGAAEIWQAEHQPVEAGLAMSGLVDMAREISRGRHRLTAVEQFYETRETVYAQAEQLSRALRMIPPKYSKLEAAFSNQLSEWEAMGCFDWINAYPETGDWLVVPTPNVHLTARMFGKTVTWLENTTNNGAAYRDAIGDTIDDYDRLWTLQKMHQEAEPSAFCFELAAAAPLSDEHVQNVHKADPFMFACIDKLSPLAALSGLVNGSFTAPINIGEIREVDDMCFILQGNADMITLRAADSLVSELPVQPAFTAVSYRSWESTQ